MVAFNWIVDNSILPVMDIVTPRNVNMSGIFGRSFAYYSMKERIPIIITRVIDHLSRDRDSIVKDFGELSVNEIKQIIGYLSKLKNEVQTNKIFEILQVKGTDAEKWNKLINEEQDPYYFTSSWLFAECYVYRRMKEAFLLTESLKSFDYFQLQKDTSLSQSLEAVCLVANNLLVDVLNTDRVKENFIQLLKMTLWGNKCDLSLSAGEDVSQSLNPMKMVDIYEDHLIVDHCNLIYEDLSKILTAQESVVIDYICDNAGYELFTDLCFADFLISKKFAHKIQFHVKAIPWFISDVTIRDFIWVLNRIENEIFSKEILLNNKGDKYTLNSHNLNALGKRWKEYVQNGIWTYIDDEFWTLPYEFYKMKDVDKNLYKQLSKAKMIFFKGDLNYRKLMGEMNWPSTTSFEDALRGFFPAPLVAVRTVKADLISGLSPGKMEELNLKDDKWMETGDYGVIQYSSKINPLLEL